MSMFRWLRPRREEKRIVAESCERAEPPDQIAELLRIIGEPDEPPKFSGGKKAEAAKRRPRGRC